MQQAGREYSSETKGGNSILEENVGIIIEKKKSVEIAVPTF
jgi:hypothetical protein